MALKVRSSLWLKVEYLSSTCSEVFADFKGSFRAQTMPITRSKQSVGAQRFPLGLDPRFVEIAVLSTESTIMAKSG